MALPSLLFGVLAVLAPLHLSAAGWGAAAIGAVWLVGAALETVQAPLVGRLSDRRGRLFPVRFALAGGAAVSVLLAVGFRPLVYAPLIVLASLAYGVLFTPGFALIADGADEVGLVQGMAFGVMNAAWALGAMIGPAAGGAIASATGDWIPFVLAAGLCLTTLVAVRRRSEDERAAVLVDRLAGDASGVRTE
jgi:MFS family permease